MAWSLQGRPLPDQVGSLPFLVANRPEERDEREGTVVEG